jgi:hypothetical protein
MERQSRSGRVCTSMGGGVELRQQTILSIISTNSSIAHYPTAPRSSSYKHLFQYAIALDASTIARVSPAELQNKLPSALSRGVVPA